ncbi:MAG: DUF1624 domain-containing protein [Lachnospiraceae bacterium]|nr:DUF1624 domain-containing protein [Lachnospiraceae bacterium]
MEKKKSGSERLALLDSLRGLTLISMILYHACWDAVYLLGANWPWYGSRAAYIWQQSICWTFIMLSGFCIPFSSKLLRRGLEVFGAGALVMAVTCLLLPEDRVVFGVLTLIGSCMLLMIPLRKILGGDSRAEATADRTAVRKASGVSRAAILFIVFAILFILFKDVNYGEIGTGMLHRIVPAIPKLTIRIPKTLYANLTTAYLGFPPADFYSTDYFSLLPWSFLYLCGYELHWILKAAGVLDAPILKKEIRPLAFMGRNSLVIYLLHQPVLYLFVLLYSALK